MALAPCSFFITQTLLLEKMGAFFPGFFFLLNLSLLTDWKNTQMGKTSKCSINSHKITADIQDHHSGFREGKTSHS